MKRCCISFYEFSMRIGSEAGVGRWWSSLQLCGCSALQNDLSKLKQLEKLEVYLLVLRSVVEFAYHSKGCIPVVILTSDFVSIIIFLPFFWLSGSASSHPCSHSWCWVERTTSHCDGSAGLLQGL